MKNLNNSLLQLMLLVRQVSKNTFLVGGCVRDMLLGREPKDFDLVTDANMESLIPLLTYNGWEVKGVGDHFLVYVVSKNGNMFEVANFRKEIGFTDGRRPDMVQIGTLEEDAARRDFTVNSIYFEPFENIYIDPNQGRIDLEVGILRFIGNPRERIKEDYLRVFRFYRFIAKLGLQPHPKSLRACREMFKEAYDGTTPERVRIEIERMSDI